LPKKIHTTKNETRSFDISATRDAEHERVFTISISSEEPYKRYGETEILGHMENEIDLSFFKSGNAPILLHHNTREQIGVIEDAWIENNRLRGRIKISRNRDDIVRDIEDGIIKNISVGYSVLKIKSIGDKAYRATFWKPYEASIVSIPADQTVGINRSEGSLEGIMDPEDDIKIEISDARKKAGEEERTRCREILAMGRRFDCSEQADKAIESAASINDFRKQVLEIVLDKQKIKSETVLVESQQEISEKGREYSILRAAEAIGSLVTGDTPDMRGRLASFYKRNTSRKPKRVEFWYQCTSGHRKHRDPQQPGAILLALSIVETCLLTRCELGQHWIAWVLFSCLV